MHLLKNAPTLSGRGLGWSDEEVHSRTLQTNTSKPLREGISVNISCEMQGQKARGHWRQGYHRQKGASSSPTPQELKSPPLAGSLAMLSKNQRDFWALRELT